MTTRTIGEVLATLEGEFEDITISKIRFLEGEGLVAPARTASGYRQFSDADVDRLRYVLRAQRDRYLPLKVIKQELDRLDAGLGVDPEAASGADVAAPPPPQQPPPSSAAPASAADDPAALHRDPAATQMTFPDLAADVRVDARILRELQDHGLLQQGDVFDADDTAIARAVAVLIELGLEARHLRMYRQFAEREAALYEQLVSPLLRQRDPDALRRAVASLEDLRRNGGTVHAHLLARQLRLLVQ